MRFNGTSDTMNLSAEMEIADMTAFIITSQGNVVGEYQAYSEDEAIQAMVEDAGYSTLEELCDAGAAKHEDFEVHLVE